MAEILDAPLQCCPEEYVCSISLEVMVNPVKLKQTGQIYDHSSFHEWITRGGSICPMTATKLRNPIILQPQTRLRNEIWRYQKELAERRQKRLDLCKAVQQSGIETSDDSWSSNQFVSREDFENKREQDVQHQLAAERIPDSPADLGTSLYQAVLSWISKRGQSVVAPKPRPSTYFVTGGNHVYSRGDLD